MCNRLQIVQYLGALRPELARILPIFLVCRGTEYSSKEIS